MDIWVHACVHIHIYLASQRGPPVSLGALVPLWCLAYGIMLGRYFCLLGWLLDMVFIWIGNLFSFESIYSTEKRSGRMGMGGGVAIRSMHRSALTRRTWVNIGHLEETNVLKCLSSHSGCFRSFSFRLFSKCSLSFLKDHNGMELFSVDHVPTSSPAWWLIYVRGKWELSGQENLNIHTHLADAWGTAITQVIDMHCIMWPSPVSSDTHQLSHLYCNLIKPQLVEWNLAHAYAPSTRFSVQGPITVVLHLSLAYMFFRTKKSILV